jgi:hypothetical protein
LLYLAAHLILKHGDGDDSLRWYYDLHLLIERWGDRIDWGALLDQARIFGWENALSAGVLGAADRFNTPLPPDLAAALREVALPERSVRMGEKPKQSPLEKTIAELGGLNWKSRIRLIITLIFPSRETIQWRYQPEPAWAWPLYYPYRWMLIVKEGIVHLVDLFRR